MATGITIFLYKQVVVHFHVSESEGNRVGRPQPSVCVLPTPPTRAWTAGVLQLVKLASNMPSPWPSELEAVTWKPAPVTSESKNTESD